MPVMIDIPPVQTTVVNLLLTDRLNCVFALMRETTDSLATLCANGTIKDKDGVLLHVQRVMLTEHYSDTQIEGFKKDRLMALLYDLNKAMPEYAKFTSLACIIESAHDVQFSPDWMIGRYAVAALSQKERIDYADVVELVDTALAEYEKHSVFLGSQVYAYHYACLMLILECADKCSFAATETPPFPITFKRNKGV